MTAKPWSRRTKVATIVPVAVLSGVWTASLFTGGFAATAAKETPGALPDGTVVPDAAIEAPASVPAPGVIAPAVPLGSADSVVSGASANGIPAAALSAYQRAAQIIGDADTSCNLPWELLAAIGRVESDHGRYAGNTLSTDGVSTPGIYGIALNGKSGTQAIQDTDAGELDRDPVFDRAVGPMQFIPSTWQVVKVDADGDDRRNPQDIDDAALASAVYLCSGEENLALRAGAEKAVFRYNHSQDYVNLVLRLMEAYQAGDYSAAPSTSTGASAISPDYTAQIAERYQSRGVKPGSVRKPSSGIIAKPKPAPPTASGGTPPSSGGSGGGSGGGPTAPEVPGGTDNGAVEDLVGGVDDAVGGIVKGGNTGGGSGGSSGGGSGGSGSGSTPPPAPDPIQTISRAAASGRCLAEVGVSSVAELLLGAQRSRYEACMDRYGY